MEAGHVRLVGAPTVGEHYSPDTVGAKSLQRIGRALREMNDIQRPSIARVAHVGLKPPLQFIAARCHKRHTTPSLSNKTRVAPHNAKKTNFILSFRLICAIINRSIASHWKATRDGGLFSAL
jgi:hypothetical protein